jgi:hypothetical protein
MSPLLQMLEFTPAYPADVQGISTGDEIPKEMDIFYRSESSFLPNGKSFKDLTEKEKEELKNRYRFDLLKSGQYQTVTGFGGIP